MCLSRSGRARCVRATQKPVATHTLIFLEVALLLPSFPTQPLPHEMVTFGPTTHFIALTHSYLNLYITFDLRFL